MKPALTIPFNFMINQEWWKEAKDTYKEETDGWMTRYVDPKTFNPLPPFKPLATLPSPLPDGESEDAEECLDEVHQEGDSAEVNDQEANRQPGQEGNGQEGNSHEGDGEEGDDEEDEGSTDDSENED